MGDGLSEGGTGQPLAGWYPDPAGSALERWWDGASWTDHLREAPTTVPPVESAAAASTWPTTTAATTTPVWPAAPTADAPAAAANPASAWPGLPASPAAPAAASPWTSAELARPEYQPMAGWGPGHPSAPISHSRLPGSPNTGAIWAIAFYPIVLVLAQLAISGLPYVAYLIAALVLSVAQLVFLIGAVIRDWVVLRRRNLPAASPLWILLTILGYLIARRVVLRRVGVRHSAPGNVFVLSLIAGVVITVTLVSSQLARPQTELAIETLERQTEQVILDQTSQTWTVACPDDAKVTVTDTQFTCAATQAGGGATASILVKVVKPLRFEIVAFNPN